MATNTPRGTAKPTDMAKIYSDKEKTAFRGWLKNPVGRPKGSTTKRSTKNAGSNKRGPPDPPPAAPAKKGRRIRGGAGSKKSASKTASKATSNGADDDDDDDSHVDSNSKAPAKMKESPPKKVAPKKMSTSKKVAVTKQKRINWAKDHRDYFEECIDDWLNQKGGALDVNGDKVEHTRANLMAYCAKVAIPFKTFHPYVYKDESKRRQLGRGVGTKPLLDDTDVSFAGDVAARYDRGNSGLNRGEMATVVQELKPHLNRGQAVRQVSRRIIPMNAKRGILKPNLVKAQSTTSDRTAITADQQYRWTKLVDDEYARARRVNTGTCPNTGKQFGELFDNFVIGLDEMCIMADHGGNIKVVAAADVKKQEKILQDSRLSITVVRTGNSAGETGPTIILCKGTEANKHKSFTDEFLVKQGLAPGSTILMTENAYMTDDAWSKCTPHLLEGYRKMPVIKDNPEWEIIEFLDGFRSHENNLEANKARTTAKVRSIKEESQTSHACQAYDQEMAKQDKKNCADTLAKQRFAKRHDPKGKSLNQWDLVIVVIEIVRMTRKNTWICSFRRVNLTPSTRVGFAEWCKKISGFMAKGSGYKPGTAEPTAMEKYSLLPDFYQGMSAKDKKKALAIVNKYEDDKSYGHECITELHDVLSIPFAHMQDLRVCIVVTKMHPEIADLEGPPSEQEANAVSASDDNVDVAKAASAASANLTRGLDAFQLIPRDEEGKAKLSDAALLQHMVKYRNHHDGADPSAHLALEIGERQMEVIKPTEDDLRRGRILKDATVESSRKLATRKLNNLGTFVGHCAVINSEENTRRMEEDLRLASTIEAIRTDAKTRAKAKAVQAQQSYRALAPKASRKLREKEGDTSKLEKKEMAALLLVVYSIFLDPKKQTNKKSVFVEKLNKAIEADPAKLAQYHNLVDSGNGQDSSANSGGDDNNIEPAATEDDDSGDDIEIDGDAYKEKRIAAFRRGALRLGTVVDFGVDEEDVDGWTIEFDDEDVVDYKDGTKGKEEDFSYAELKHSLQLYDEEGFMLESAE